MVMTRAGAAMLRRAENQLIEAVHTHIRSGAGEPIVARILEPELRPVAELSSVSDWQGRCGREAVRTQVLVYTHFALKHVAVLERHWRLRLVDEQCGRVRLSEPYLCRSGCADREAIDVTAASVGFMVSVLQGFGDTIASRRTLLDVLHGAGSFAYLETGFQRERRVLVHPGSDNLDLQRGADVDKNFIQYFILSLASIDRFKAATVPAWRTERGEPWRVLTQWRRARDFYPRPEPDMPWPAMHPAMLGMVKDLEGFSSWKNNFGVFWYSMPSDQDTPMWGYPYQPRMLRFAKEHPELHAQLKAASRRALGPDGRDVVVNQRLYQAFRIMCTYTDLIDCADPEALSR